MSATLVEKGENENNPMKTDLYLYNLLQPSKKPTIMLTEKRVGKKVCQPFPQTVLALILDLFSGLLVIKKK